ncbi:glycosyltransferase [Patescibacteria group bacterium]|nr:glycosyltransferase [Patescibacteria group bacterium]
MTPKVSIIIPNYNEKENLERGVLEEVVNYLNKAKFTWEVIINDDGSTDGSIKILESFVNNHKGFKLIKGNHGGKACGLWSGIKKAKGDIVLFTDMDQSTPLKEIEKLLPWYKKGFNVVFGSRGKARKNFPFVRQLTSWGFRVVRQTFLLKNISDTQCGFKSLKREIALEIFPKLSVIKNAKNAKGWTVSAYDVELLFLAEKAGYKLKEVDVVWRNEDVSTGKGKNFITESIDMFNQIITVKLNDLKGKYNQ